jgi:hypothetical protein
MYAGELEASLLVDPYAKDLLCGIYSASNLPKNIVTRPALLIANTDPSTKKGSHWIAIYLDAYGRGEFFCSYGMAPFVKQHKDFLDRNCTTWTHNTTQLQSFSSSLCGQYCVLFLAHRARGLFLDDFLWHFKKFKNYKQNDAFIRSKFRIKIASKLNAVRKHLHGTEKLLALTRNLQGQCCCSHDAC